MDSEEEKLGTKGSWFNQKLLLWFVGGIVANSVLAPISEVLRLPSWLVLPVFALALAGIAVAAYVAPEGPLRRVTGYPIAALVAIVLSFCLPTVAILVRGQGELVGVVIVAFSASVIATIGLIAAFGVSWDKAALSGLQMMLSVTSYLRAVESMGDGEVLVGFSWLLFGIAALLTSLGSLLSRLALVGAGAMVLSAACLVVGAAALHYGFTWATVWFVSVGVSILLYGIGALRGWVKLPSAFAMVFGVVGLLLGVWFLQDGSLLIGIACLAWGAAGLLLGLAVRLLGVAALSDGPKDLEVVGRLAGIAALMSGVSGVLYSARFLSDGSISIGVAALTAGVLGLSIGAVELLGANPWLKGYFRYWVTKKRHSSEQ